MDPKGVERTGKASWTPVWTSTVAERDHASTLGQHLEGGSVPHTWPATSS
jgi:hypothetical protein